MRSSKTDVMADGNWEKNFMHIKKKVVNIVEDGPAPGETEIAAIKYVTKQKPKGIIFAVPVCAYDSLKKLQFYVSKIVSIISPPQLTSISEYYESFPQTSDEDVIKLLNKKIKVNK